MTPRTGSPAAVAPPRERSRMGLWVACAIAWHAGLLSAGRLVTDAGATPPFAPRAADTEFEVDLTAPVETPAPDSDPGGGSLAPDDSEPPVAGVANPTDRSRLAPTVRAPEPGEATPLPPALPAEHPEEENDEESTEDEVASLTQDGIGDFLLPVDVKPRAARVSMLGPRLPSDPAIGDATHDSRGRQLGSGPGASGGPGGAGKGWSPRHEPAGNPFGGKTGAWRGEICLLPRGTTTLKGVGSCPRAGEIFTDVIDVSPRRFDKGFPGVTDRNEYFAIKYTGTFVVREIGVYGFRVHADDGAILTIDDQRVIDNDGVHEPRSRSCLLTLDEGPHKFRLTYFQGPRYDIALQVFVKPFAQPERLFRPVI